jgi:antitoxin MazE
MQVALKRWGNSIGLRIPKGIADSLGLKADDTVDIVTTKDGLVVKKTGKKYVLKELLSRVTPENRHGSIDWGGPKGNELL